MGTTAKINYLITNNKIHTITSKNILDLESSLDQIAKQKKMSLKELFNYAENAEIITPEINQILDLFSMLKFAKK